MNQKRGSQVRSFSSQAQKRGLSPVIATVLLVGLVVVSGLIIFTWFRSLTQEAIIKFDQNIQLVCKDISFEASYSPAENTLAISNLGGNIPIFGFKIKIYDTSGFETIDISDFPSWPPEGLNQGGAAEVDLGSTISDDTTEIVLTPVLRGVSQKGAESLFTCDENLYGQQILVN